MVEDNKKKLYGLKREEYLRKDIMVAKRGLKIAEELNDERLKNRYTKQVEQLKKKLSEWTMLQARHRELKNKLDEMFD